MTLGTLYGISVGPGDPELISLKGWRRLQAAPVVAFPAGRGGQPGFAERSIAPWLQAHQIQLPLAFAFVQDPERLQAAWQQAAAQVWPYLQQGHDVAFACEGDVSFYSTFTYLAQTLQQQHPEVKIVAIPGVCSPLAAAAELGLPLTVQQQRLTILPALYAVQDLERAIAHAEVIVLLKVSSVYPEVWRVLQKHDLLARSWAIERATQPDQRVYADLRDRPALELSYFSLLIIQVTLPNPANVSVRD